MGHCTAGNEVLGDWSTFPASDVLLVEGTLSARFIGLTHDCTCALASLSQPYVASARDRILKARCPRPYRAMLQKAYVTRKSGGVGINPLAPKGLVRRNPPGRSHRSASGAGRGPRSARR
eukprot:scaffold1254_cov251-Pinguiococcus_pyrenoidosus.AAC.1